MPGIEIRADKRNELERRAVAREMDLRSTPDGTGGETLTFTGYASVVDSPYEMADMFGDYTEVIRAGAFAKTLSDGADVPFKVNHTGITLARTKSGTMQLAEDSTGLHVTAQLDPSSPDVQSLRSAMQRGDLDEMSFAFRVIRQEWSPDWSQRDITEVSLHKGDVSAVNYGANPATAGAMLRSRDFESAFAEWRASADPADIARLLRELETETPAETFTPFIRRQKRRA
jgi:HK97 family phage prohead protease